MAAARFDAKALIAHFGDETLVAELAELLLAHAFNQVDAVHDAIAAGDPLALTSSAHKLKGSLGTFRADSVTVLVIRLESMGRTGVLDGAADLARQLDAEVHALCDSARDWLRGRAA